MMAGLREVHAPWSTFAAARAKELLLQRLLNRPASICLILQAQPNTQMQHKQVRKDMLVAEEVLKIDKRCFGAAAARQRRSPWYQRSMPSRPTATTPQLRCKGNLLPEIIHTTSSTVSLASDRFKKNMKRV